MNDPFRNSTLFLALLSIALISCQVSQDKPEHSENAVSVAEKSNLNPAEEEIKATVDRLLIAAGNYDLEVLDEMTSDKAMIGISSSKDGVWTNTELTIAEYFENVKNRELTPYCEIANDYDIIVTEGRLALVRADAILHRFGIPKNREINHFTLIKENGQWKFLNISFTVEPLDAEKKKFDLSIFARGYAQAWCSKRPGFVASFFAKDGLLQVNDGEPAVGTKAITEVAKGFMDAFPDIIVSMDSLTTRSNVTRFHWTLTGTNNVPNGTGNAVNISGYEEWTLNEEGFVQSSKGHFDVEEYDRQLNGTD